MTEWQGNYGYGDYSTFSDPYSTSVADPYAAAPAAAPARTPSINYSGYSATTRPMVLMEDMDASEQAASAPTVSMNHSQKRPFTGMAEHTPKFSRGGSGARGGRGGARGGSRGGSAPRGGGYSSTGRGGGYGQSGGFGGRGGGAVRGRGSPRGRGGAAGGFQSSYSKPANVSTAAGKHPASFINEAYKEREWNVVVHNKLGICNKFVVLLSLEPNDKYFIGAGPSDKLAKHEAALTAMKQLNVNGLSGVSDHLSESNREEIVAMRQFRIDGQTKRRCLPGSDKEVKMTHYLQKVYGDHAPECVFEDPTIIPGTKAPNTLFLSILKIGGYEIQELGPSKDKAKELCAATAVAMFEKRSPKFMRTDDRDAGEEGGEDVRKDNLEGPVSGIGKKEQGINEQLANLALTTIKNSAGANMNKDMLSMDNMAGVYLQEGPGAFVEEYTMVGLATGAGSANKNTLKPDGSLVHDRNAEVLVMRAVRIFLYDELEKAIARKDSVLQKEGNKYRLAPQYKLVMVKNQMPAGDAMVFEGVANHGQTRVFPFSTQGQPGALQFSTTGKKYLTDASLEGKPNLEKHCIACPSDKLTMRNIAGVQGALLSQFLQPVYISRFIFPKMAGRMAVDSKNLNRCFFERVEAQIYKVPPPFKINKPEFVFHTSNQRGLMNVERHCSSGWMLSGGKWEVVKNPEGMAVTDTDAGDVFRWGCFNDVEYYEKKLAIAKRIAASMIPSELSKKALFARYKAVCAGMARKTPDSYFACKALSDEYHAVKLSVTNAFTKAKLGSWPTKPVNTESFKL